MEEEPADGANAAPGSRRGPGPMMRFLVVVFGVLFFGTGRAVAQTGGVVGVVLGVVIQLTAVGIVAIAVGLVEWAMRARRPPG